MRVLVAASLAGLAVALGRHAAGVHGRRDRRDGVVRAEVGVAIARALSAHRSRRRAAAARAHRERALPLVAEVMRMGLSSGLTVHETLRRAAAISPPVMAGPLAAVVEALDLGDGVAPAVERMAAEAPDLARLAHLLAATADLGVEASPALAALSDDARAAWLRRAQARARVVPVRLLFPLVFLVLPAFALLGVAPGLLVGLTP